MAAGDLLFGLLVVLLTMWITLTVICQIPREVGTWSPTRMESWVRAHDILGLVPRWHFFAPIPATDNLHLLYRDQLPDGQVTRWSEVPPSRPARWLGPVWHPGRRHNKAVVDVVVELSRIMVDGDHDADRIQVTVPYIAALNFVSCLPRDRPARATQFLVMRSNGAGEDPDPHVVMSSAMHPLEQGQCPS